MTRTFVSWDGRDDVGKVLSWLVERELPPPVKPCARCGHDADHHRLDDGTNVSPTDPAAEFRCVWPMPAGPAVQLCSCPGYVEWGDSPMPEGWGPAAALARSMFPRAVGTRLPLAGT